MSTRVSVSTPAAVTAAAEAIGGLVAPLNRALRGLGWPYLSRSAIHARRIAGTLPVVPQRLGGRWVVYAKDVARMFEDVTSAASGSNNEPPAVVPHRGPGRPRKVAREQQP
jgi:hypothetical protein